MSDLRKVKCLIHDTFASHICITPNCHSRIICNNCFKDHNNDHLKYFVRFEDLTNGKILNEFTNYVDHRQVAFDENLRILDNALGDLRNIIEIQLANSRLRIYEKLKEKYDFPTLMNHEDIRNFFKSLFKNGDIVKDLDFLSVELEKIRKFGCQELNITYNEEDIKKISSSIQTKILEIEEKIVIQSFEEINPKKITNILKLKSQGSNFLSNPFHSSENFIAIGSTDTGIVDLYKMNQYKSISHYKRFETMQKILAVKVISKKNTIAVTGDHLVHLINYETSCDNQRLRTYNKHQIGKFVYALEYLEKGGFVVSGGNDKFLRIWNIDDLLDYQIIELNSEIGSIKYFSPNYLITGHKNGEIMFFRFSFNGRIYFNFSKKLHNDWICSFDINLERNLLITGSNDTKLCVWRVDEENITLLKDCLNIENQVGFIRGVKYFEREGKILFTNWSDQCLLYSINNEDFQNIANSNASITASYACQEDKIILTGDNFGIVNIYTWL